MSNPTRKIQRRRKMSDSHEHAHNDSERPAPLPQPSPESYIGMLKQRLEAKTTEISRLEDIEVQFAACINDLITEKNTMVSIINQITTENRELRKRLGIDELAVIETVESLED